MKKSSPLLFCIGSVFTALVIPTFAQSIPEVRLTGDVPFEFHVGGKTLPAGKYKIRSTDSEGIRFTSADGRAAGYITSHAAAFHGQPGQPSLVFQRYGNEMVLTQIWTGSMSREFPLSRSERNLARNAQPSPTYVSFRAQ